MTVLTVRTWVGYIVYFKMPVIREKMLINPWVSECFSSSWQSSFVSPIPIFAIFVWLLLWYFESNGFPGENVALWAVAGSSHYKATALRSVPVRRQDNGSRRWVSQREVLLKIWDIAWYIYMYITYVLFIYIYILYILHIYIYIYIYVYILHIYIYTCMLYCT